MVISALPKLIKANDYSVLRIPAFCIAVVAVLISPRSYGDLPRGAEIRAFMSDACIVSGTPRWKDRCL
jgi:hypothetical protein